MIARIGRANAGGSRGRAVAAALRAAALGTPAGEEATALAAVERRRAEVPFEMVASGRSFGFGPAPMGAGEGGVAPAPREPDRAEQLGNAWEVCRWSTIPPLWGRFFFALVRELQPQSCVELGTGLGLSGLYEGAALRLNGSGSLTTFDREDAARIAEEGFQRAGLSDRVTLCFGDIDETLPAVGPSLAPVDFALLDAEHSGPATTRHFELLLPHLGDQAVLVFDDITQTEEMRRAWRDIVAHPRVVFNLALRRYGVVVVSEAPASF
jgi:predicted O-methyltransferase YrrM